MKRRTHPDRRRAGMTLAEIVIAVMIFAIVAAAGISLMNPGGQLARGRNSERTSHINAILNAIRQNISDNRTGFSCTAGPIPTTTVRMASAGATTTYDIAPCLVSVYLQQFPYDPSATGAHYAGVADYDSAYYVSRNASSGQITVSAPLAEAKKIISVTR